MLQPDPETGLSQHTIPNVYREALLQICSDYPGLPDPRTLTILEIRFFYEGLRRTLKEHTRPKDKPRPPRRR